MTLDDPNFASDLEVCREWLADLDRHRDTLGPNCWERVGMHRDGLPTAAIFVSRHRGQSGYRDDVFHDDEPVLRMLTKILDDPRASPKCGPDPGLQDA